MVIDLTTGQQTVCGCSLLNHAHALTAAHCWWDGEHQARLFTVVYGSARLFSGGLRLPTDRVAVHEGWDPDTITNDVAVITHAHVAFNGNPTDSIISLLVQGRLLAIIYFLIYT